MQKRDFETMLLDHMSYAGTKMPGAERKRYTLELSIAEGDRFSFPLLMRTSNIYKDKEVFYVESFRALSDLRKQVGEWFKKNSTVNSEENFQNFEKPFVEDICSSQVKTGFLILYFGKKSYSRIDVNIFDNIVRLSKLDDYNALQETLTRIFESLVSEFKDF